MSVEILAKAAIFSAREQEKHPRRLLEICGQVWRVLALDKSQEQKGLRPVQASRDAAHRTSVRLSHGQMPDTRGYPRTTSLRHSRVRSSGTFISWNQPRKCGRQDAEASSLGVFAHRVSEWTPAFRRQRKNSEIGRRENVPHLRSRSLLSLLAREAKSLSRRKTQAQSSLPPEKAGGA
jgi:hypothetical protein